MLPVLAVDQMSVPFVHRMSVVSVLAPMETMLYLLHRYCTLPHEGTCCSLPHEETSCSLPLEETSCFLPLEETSCSLPLEGTSCSLLLKDTSCSLPLEETSCFLPLDRTSYSLVIASGPEVAFVTPAIPVDHFDLLHTSDLTDRWDLEIPFFLETFFQCFRADRGLPRHLDLEDTSEEYPPTSSAEELI
ncbi:hypothetical protein Tco_0048537 [Tanacetum coccineum]